MHYEMCETNFKQSESQTPCFGLAINVR